MADDQPKLSPLFQRVLDTMNSTIEGMSDEQFRWSPPDKWSAAQILEHLGLAFSATEEKMASVLTQASSTQSSLSKSSLSKSSLSKSGAPDLPGPNLRQRIAALLVLRFSYIPPGRKSPEHILPRGIAPDEAAQAARAGLLRLDKAISQCEARFGGNAAILMHPILGPLNANDWRKFHKAHALHHIEQIVELRVKMRKPKL
jgi:DinB superfamily